MTSASPGVSSPERSTPGFAGRQAPWSNEAEQAVLGAMLLDQDAALKAAGLLDDTMFYREGHRLLFRSMIALTERGDVIDPVTLRDELLRRGDFDRARGMGDPGSLIDVGPAAANAEYHAKIVRDKAGRRRPTVHGEDGARAQRGAARRDRAQRGDRGLFPRNVERAAGAAAALLRGPGGCAAVAPRPAARRRLPQARPRGRPVGHGADLDRRLGDALAPRHALQSTSPQGGARRRPGGGRLPADDAGPHRLREPAAGDLVHLPLARPWPRSWTCRWWR